MNTLKPEIRKDSEKGFTLVELAIVMIIIGLLIGGILKGQELIANAQVTATVSQAKGIDAAVSTFRDAYDSFPGDMRNPSARLPGCADDVNCDATDGVGSGDGRVDGVLGGVQVAGEGVNFWTHLTFGNLLSGISTPGDLTWGGGLPSAEIGGGFTVGWYGGGAPPEGTLGGNLRGGHWIAIQAAPNDAIGGDAGTDALTPTQAARIDRKMDDGSPTSGSVQPGGSEDCVATGEDVPTIYNEANSSTDCGLYIRIQG